MEILILNSIMILFIITIVWDFSGIIFDLSKFIYTKLNPNKLYLGQQLPKIISCSYCIKFHSLWIYLIIFNGVSIINGLFIASVGTFIGLLLVKLLRVLEKLINRIE